MSSFLFEVVRFDFLGKNVYLGYSVQRIIVFFSINVQEFDDERKVLASLHHQVVKVVLEPEITKGKETSLKLGNYLC